MNVKITETLTREIDELVAVGERLSNDASRSSDMLGPQRVEQLSSIASRGGQLIRRLYGSDSHYESQFKRVLAT